MATSATTKVKTTLAKNETTESVSRLSKDLVNSAKSLTVKEAKYLVRTYYRLQDDRIRAAARSRALSKDNTPHELFEWVTAQSAVLEKQLVRALDRYTEAQPMGEWLRNIYGIGPVISAGLLANTSVEIWKCVNKKKLFVKKEVKVDEINLEEGIVDLEDDEEDEHICTPENPCSEACHHERIETAGSFWSYAGLDPTVKWEKGCIRPWNANLKKLCWLIGQSFMKFSGQPKCFYGHIYLQRKEYEIKKNAERVAKGEKPLTDAHINARARRYAVKIFLSHFHAESYRRHFKEEPAKPFAIAILGHAHMIYPPEQLAEKPKAKLLSKD